MHFTNALFTTLSLLSLASASPVAKTLSPAPRSPLERRAPDCTQDDDHLKCVCEACDETEDFKVAFPSLVPDDACSTIIMPVLRLNNPGGVTGWTCNKRNDDKFHACCRGEDV